MSIYVPGQPHALERLQNHTRSLHSRGKLNIYKTFNDMLTAFAFEAVILHTIHRLFMPVSQNTGTKEEIEELYDSSCSGRHIR